MTVGERIKEKRIELGWSQQELAKKAGYSDKTAISKIEHAGNEVTLKQIKRIAKSMNVDPTEFMGWSEVTHNTLIDTPDVPFIFEVDKGDREGARFIEYAKQFYEHYQKASPEIQKAVDLLLKVDKQP